MAEMVSALKLLAHRERLAAYLRGERVFPVTLELGLTARCNRSCPDCPSSLGDASMSLELDLVERLLALLEGRTRGLIVTGGEPTLHPGFADVLALARRYGFVDVAVVTNGSRLDDPDVVGALVEHASAVRISLYDWRPGSLDGLRPTLDRIARLRALVEGSRSHLQIGASVLTRDDTAVAVGQVAEAAANAGAHWIYLHPTCTRGDGGRVASAEQHRAAEAARAARRRVGDRATVHLLGERYGGELGEFNGYHAAHFVLVIGADGGNYLATEAKYQKRHLLADLRDRLDHGFLWAEDRVARIAAVHSDDYPPGHGRNRGVLYSALIERLRRGEVALEQLPLPPGGFALPNLI